MIHDRLEQAERQLLDGDLVGALRALQGILLTVGTRRDAARLQAIVELGERIKSLSVGSTEKEARYLLFVARRDLAFAHKQDALVDAKRTVSEATAQPPPRSPPPTTTR